MKDKGGLENSQRWETGLMTTSSHSRWINKEKKTQAETDTKVTRNSKNTVNTQHSLGVSFGSL